VRMIEADIAAQAADKNQAEVKVAE